MGISWKSWEKWGNWGSKGEYDVKGGIYWDYTLIN